MFDDFWKYALGIVTVAGLIMAFARTGPDDAKANLVRWAKAFGFTQLQEWIKIHRPDLWIARFGTVLAAVGSASFTYIASIDKLKENIPFNRQELDAQAKAQAAQIEALKKRIAELEQPNPDPNLRPSLMFGLTDVNRWRLSNLLREKTKSGDGTAIRQVRVISKPSGINTAQAWGETSDIIRAGGWKLAGGSTPKSVYPPGITINVAEDRGAAFDCGYRLSEFYEGLGVVPVSFRANVTTPDLVECKQCVEVVLGDITTPKPKQ